MFSVSRGSGNNNSVKSYIIVQKLLYLITLQVKSVLVTMIVYVVFHALKMIYSKVTLSCNYEKYMVMNGIIQEKKKNKNIQFYFTLSN